MERVFDVFQRNVIVTNLSGGMKRKVNLGIALIGGSKVSKKNQNFTINDVRILSVSNGAADFGNISYKKARKRQKIQKINSKYLTYFSYIQK